MLSVVRTSASISRACESYVSAFFYSAALTRSMLSVALGGVASAPAVLQRSQLPLSSRESLVPLNSFPVRRVAPTRTARLRRAAAAKAQPAQAVDDGFVLSARRLSVAALAVHVLTRRLCSLARSQRLRVSA